MYEESNLLNAERGRVTKTSPGGVSVFSLRFCICDELKRLLLPWPLIGIAAPSFLQNSEMFTS